MVATGVVARAGAVTPAGLSPAPRTRGASRRFLPVGARPRCPPRPGTGDLREHRGVVVYLRQLEYQDRAPAVAARTLMDLARHAGAIGRALDDRRRHARYGVCGRHDPLHGRGRVDGDPTAGIRGRGACRGRFSTLLLEPHAASKLPASTNPMYEDVLFRMVSLTARFSKERANPQTAGNAARPPRLRLFGARCSCSAEQDLLGSGRTVGQFVSATR